MDLAVKKVLYRVASRRERSLRARSDTDKVRRTNERERREMDEAVQG
jgi:hypothetical protein